MDTSVTVRAGSASVLPVRRLGRTDMQITRVGFGAWAIGGADWAVGWGAQDDRDFDRRDPSRGRARHQLDRHRGGLRPRPLRGGRAPGARRYPADRASLCVHQVRAGLGRGEPHGPPQQVGAPASIRREVEASLKRLGVERIDLYQMHWPAEDGTKLGDLLADAAGSEARRARSARSACPTTMSRSSRRPSSSATSIRCSRHSPPSGAASRRRSCPGATEHETGVIVYSPMQSGPAHRALHRGARAGRCRRTIGGRATPSSRATSSRATCSSPTR